MQGSCPETIASKCQRYILGFQWSAVPTPRNVNNAKVAALLHIILTSALADTHGVPSALWNIRLRGVYLLPERQGPNSSSHSRRKGTPETSDIFSQKCKRSDVHRQALSIINSKPCVTVLFLKGLAECSAWWAPSSCNYLISYFFSSDLFWHRAETTDSTALCARWEFQQSHCVSLHQSCPCLRVLTFSAWRKERKKPRPSSKGMPRKWVETGGRFANPAAVLTLGLQEETARQIIV